MSTTHEPAAELPEPAADPGRDIPSTDTLLTEPALASAVQALGIDRVKAAIHTAQHAARTGSIAREEVLTATVAAVHRALGGAAAQYKPLINATGVIVHTSIGRAPLSMAAQEAMLVAASCVDVEFDTVTGHPARRGRSTIAALTGLVPAAADALVVNNGAAAVLLATTALAAGREVILSRGEMIEIGDGYRLPDLIESNGARLREVGTTNRTTLNDYTDAITTDTGAVLKVHPANFRMEGFTSQVSAAELAPALDGRVPLIVDIGSGLLHPEPTLPDEPDATTTLRAGANLVTASGDKLLGGPQAGLILGDADLVQRIGRLPLARAVRVDKVTLAALEATLRGPIPPVVRALRTRDPALRDRTVALAHTVGLSERSVVRADGRVGGGGAPGHRLPGWALALPEQYAAPLRTGTPGIVGRLDGGRCLLDLRCVPAQQDDAIAEQLIVLLGAGVAARFKPTTSASARTVAATPPR